ncbi:MAG: class I SAM-dependent methyltransferase [Chthoniobacterales bacterium]
MEPTKRQNRSSPFADELRVEIAERGPVTFAWFMEQALYQPEHGYYSSGRARIGRKGDYFTSVSLGPLFGKMMAMQFAEIRELLGATDAFTIVEQGAHDGQFARDVLEHLDVRYLIIEPSAKLRERQAEPSSGFRIEWRESLDDLEPFVGVHFSNELIDSLPVHVVKWTGNEWLERRVGLTNDHFQLLDWPISDQELVAKIPQPLPAGYETEARPAARRWIETLANKLTRGFVIAADYGFARDEFYAPHRTRGTLQSYAEHTTNDDPLQRVGEADITAHVEWTSLAEHAIGSGLQLAGFTDQHHFLTGLLNEELTADAQNTRALQTLIHPGFLGTKFQFLVLAKKVDPAIRLRGLRFARDAATALSLGRAEPD